MKRLLLILLMAASALAQKREVTAGVHYEELLDFEEAFVAVKYQPLIVRVATADDDVQLEAEAYPRLAPKTYAYLAAGASTESTRYADWRLGAELFHGFGKGWEASLGTRQLQFDRSINVQTASLGKYIGNWLIVGRAYHADDFSWQAQARRYYSDAGSYAALRAGVSRDELRTGPDVQSLDANEVVAELRHLFAASPWTVTARAGLTRLRGGQGLTAGFALGYRY